MSAAIHYKNSLSDHLHASRVWYARGKFAKADKILAILLFGFGVWEVSTVGPQWWAVVWFAVAPIEWFNLLSIRPLQIRYQFKTASIDSQIAWTFYSGLIESDRVFLLMYGRAMYSVIPKRALDGEEQIGEFREMARRNIK